MIEREEILEHLFLFKDSVDYLRSREFFRTLLEVYRELSELDGFGEWVDAYRRIDNCTDCDDYRRRLLSGLIFQFGESKIHEILDRIVDLKEMLDE